MMADVLIIGNGPAAISAAEAIRERDKKSEITIITPEPWSAYTPCFLARYLSGEAQRDALFMKDLDFYKRMEIEFLPEKEAVGIDPSSQEVRLSDGNVISYRRLLLAAGASAVYPPVEGIKGEGVYAFKTLKDAETLRQKTGDAEGVIVLGAGFIGLEVAEALNALGKRVIIIEKEAQVLPRMLSPDLADILKGHIEERGDEIMTCESVEEVLRDGGGAFKGIRLKSGKNINADLMVIAAGVRPNIDFLKGSGINTERGVLVDATMRTNIEGVYAAGDIAEVEIKGTKKVNPIHLNAIKTGRLTGLNILGFGKRLDGHIEDMNMLRIFDMFVFSAGDITPEVHTERGKDTLIKTFYSERGLCGVQIIGEPRRAGRYLWQIGKDQPFSELKRLIKLMLYQKFPKDTSQFNQ